MPDPDHPLEPNPNHLTMVGIGASAGGIAALKTLFGAMPPDSGMAFAVILHLSEQFESNLASILQSHTPMPVSQVTETVRVEPNHVYVIPPAKHLALVDGEIRLTEPERVPGRRVPIDLFFRTLADAYGPSGICVVLSGTGSDGTLGLKRVKENGGFAIAQDLGDAEYDGMPRSAIATGLVDFVLPVAAIPARLVALKGRGEQFQIPEGELPDLGGEEALREVLTLLRVRTGHDFLSYKRPTVLRRVARRLQVHELENLGQYLDFLRQNPGELQSLLGDLLISVTNFFRDKEAFSGLEHEAIPALFQNKTRSDTVRVWVPGCASGEEAYSVAILLREYAATLHDPPGLQIFATDISEEAIAAAREGRFEENIVADVSPERLRQFFIKEGERYRVKGELRETVLFAPHDLLRDPPFSKLDLISCRNLLIYLSRATQEKVLELFNFALRPGGFLFLGSSESAEGQPAAFAPVDKRHRLYRSRKTAGVLAPLPTLPTQGHWQVRLPEPVGAAPERSYALGELHLRLLEQFTPPSVLVNEDFEIVHLSERAGNYLRFGGGEPSRDLLKLAQPELRLDLRAVLMAAKQEGHESEVRNVRVQVNGEERRLNLSARPAGLPEAPGFLLVVLEDRPAEARPEEPSLSDSLAGNLEVEAVVRRLEQELKTAQDRLRGTIEQYETSTEELKASNEELQAINEELRSASEELETSKEELQSVNEELTTVNHELKDKVDELSRVNSDLQNLMASTNIGTIFLDRGLRIKRFTPRAQELFNIIASDVGRPLEHLTHRLVYENLGDDAASVLSSLSPVEREVRGPDGCWYIAGVRPYRTLEDRIDGVVLTFVDITQRKGAEEALAESEEKYRTLFDSIDEGFAVIDLILDEKGRPFDTFHLEANPAYERHTGLHGIVGKRGLEVMPAIGEWLDFYGDVARTGQAMRLEYYVEPIGRWLTAYVFRVGGEGSLRLAVVFNDITERKRREANLAFLAEVSQDLVKLTNTDETMNVLSAKISEYFHLARCVFAEIREAEDKVIIIRDWYRPELSGLGGEIPLSQFVSEEYRRKSRAGEITVVPDVHQSSLVDGRQVEDVIGVASFVNVPLLRDGQWRFTLGIYDAAPRDWREDEIELLRELATRIWAWLERARAEEALQVVEERQRLLIESAVDYAILTTTQDGRIDSWNPGAERIFGYPEAEILGRDVAMIFTPEDREQGVPQRERETATATGRAADERYHLRKNGERFYVSGVMVPLLEGGKHGFAKIARDLSERKAMEEGLREADRRKDEFLAVLGHELRNPLAPLLSGLEILRRTEGEQGRAEALEVVEGHTRQITRMVDDLLEVARITNGKVNLRPEPLELRPVLEQAVAMSRHPIEEKGQRLTLSLPSKPIRLRADPARLAQIFSNLLSNASKYSPQGADIRLGAAVEDGQATVRVRDDGSGIPPEQLTQVFELFAQLEHNRTGGQGGLGIGLNLVKQLVEMHGGSVEAKSDGPGHGSEFVVRLPLSEEKTPPKPARAKKGKKAPTKGKRVLVVDDYEAGRNTLARLLRMLGHEVRAAEDGPSGLQAAADFQPQVILMDINMPGMSGLEAARLLRGRLDLNGALLVALTGYGQPEDVERSRAAGFDRHLVKPVGVDALEKLLSDEAGK